MSKPRLPKSKIECPDCNKASGFPLGDAKGFSRRRFLQVGATGIVASYFLDVFNPRVLYGKTIAPNVALRNTATNAIAATIPVGQSPVGVAASPDGLHIYVTNQNSGTLSVINTATNTVSATVTLGGLPAQCVVTPDDGATTGRHSAFVGRPALLVVLLAVRMASAQRPDAARALVGVGQLSARLLGGELGVDPALG